MTNSEKLKYAIRLHQRNDFQQTLEILDVLREDSENIHALHSIGLIFKQNGWQEQGDAYLARTVTMSSSCAEANHNKRVLQNPITRSCSLEESAIETSLDVGASLGVYPAALLEKRCAKYMHASY
jgi:hypothetical protein